MARTIYNAPDFSTYPLNTDMRTGFAEWSPRWRSGQMRFGTGSVAGQIEAAGTSLGNSHGIQFNTPPNGVGFYQRTRLQCTGLPLDGVSFTSQVILRGSGGTSTGTGQGYVARLISPSASGGNATLRITRADNTSHAALTLGAMVVGEKWYVEADVSGHLVRARAYKDGTAVPAWQLEYDFGVSTYKFDSGWAGMGMYGVSGEHADYFHALQVEVGTAPPATPTVTVDQITATGGRINATAYSHPSSVAQQARQFRVRSGATVAASSGSLAPGTASWAASGLTASTAYTWEARDQDMDGEWGFWGSVNASTDAPPGSLKIRYRVSSEDNWDFLRIYVDGVRVVNASGSPGWQTYVGSVLADGEHTLRFQYIKDDSASAGEDRGYIDHIEWNNNNLEDFEDATLNGSLTGDWEFSTTTPYAGSRSLASKVITHLQESNAYFVINTAAGVQSPKTPAKPAVSVSALTATSGRITASAYSHPSGTAQQARAFRVMLGTGIAASSGALAPGTSFWDATGLTPNREYSWEARDQDTAGEWSEWGVTLASTPPAVPPTPPAVGAAQIMDTYATLRASAYEHYEATGQQARQYRVIRVSDSVQVYALSAGAASGITSVVLPAGTLAALTQYRLEVRDQDTVGVWSDWSTATFTTRETSGPLPPPPIADFTWTPKSPHIAEVVSFVNLSTVSTL